MEITVSRWVLFSHPLEEKIELTEDLVEEVFEWGDDKNRRIRNRKIKDCEDFFEVLAEYLEDYVIDDPIVEKITDMGGGYYPGNDGHDENHIEFGEPTAEEEAMIMKAIAQFNQIKY